MGERTFLVTGAAGFVGGYVLAALRERGGRVLGMVRRRAQGAKIRALGAEPVEGDVTEPGSLSRVMEGVYSIVHLAAVNRGRGGLSMEMVNHQGTVNVLAAAKAAGVQRLVQVIGIGGDSRSAFPLPRTQGLAADAVLGSGLPATVLEAGVIYGRGDAFVTALAGLARLSPVVVVPGSGRARFEPISCEDVAGAAVNALDMPEAAGQRFRIAGPEVLTLDQVYDLILLVLRLRRIKLHVPMALLRPLVRLMDGLLPEPPVTSSLLDLLELDILAEENGCSTLLGREPRRFHEGLAYANEVTAARFLSITLGRRDRRALAGSS